METKKLYDKTRPFRARLLCREPLSSPNSTKNTQHIELCLKGSGLLYDVGDCLAVLPSHDLSLIEKTLQQLGGNGEQQVSYREIQGVSLIDLLTNQVNITTPTKKLLELIVKKGCSPKTSFLEALLSDDKLVKNYLASKEVWQVLQDWEPQQLSPEEICATLSPLLPRFYSIASSQKTVGDVVHLTIAPVAYEKEGAARKGVCTHFLCGQPHVEQVPVYLHPHRGFTLPKDPSTPIIMIGPGTGIAPFRAFMQERVATRATGKNWLFFGERNCATDFLYGPYWTELEERGLLRLSTAFSRDQEEKIYVQHRMLEESVCFFAWLEEGAHLFVCGDATKMAKDVEATLLKIIEKEGKMTPEQASAYVKRLRTEKRYLRDVY